MSTIVQGDPTQVSGARIASIVGATNASPIVIQTASPHLYVNGDLVDVIDVGGNTAANGTWTITLVDSTHFSLNGTTGSGAYTSGGIATDLFLTPPIQCPANGEAFDAASILSMIEGLADRTQFLQSSTLKLRSVTFTANGFWTPPVDATPIGLVYGCGGGGGGGGGVSGDTTAGHSACGGGGGGGAIAQLFAFTFFPGEQHTITIGAGGAGGANIGNPGVTGGNTIITFGSPLIAFFGAEGGLGGFVNTNSSTLVGHAPGGRTTPGGLRTQAKLSDGIMPLTQGLGCGGDGIDGQPVIGTSTVGYAGYSGINAQPGGAGGPLTAPTGGGRYQGGPGGGGGGGLGAGGAGGHGGTQSDSVGGGAGGNGGAGSLGDGGGGGGGGGCGLGSAGAGGSGGAGGHGYLQILYFSRS